MKKIVIATPLYPPQIGGPAQYAFNLEREFRALGYQVVTVKFATVLSWPAGLRHLIYFFKLWPALHRADCCLILDTFSVALPAVLAAKIFGVKTIIRTGGDFLWEFYVERTNDLVLLRHFYQTRLLSLSIKERLIFWLSRWVVLHCQQLVFSTVWQQKIWHQPYRLTREHCSVIENYYGPKEKSELPPQKIFLTGTRPLKWKNQIRLTKAFIQAQTKISEIFNNDSSAPFNEFIKKIAGCYAVVLVSLGDISPNLILDAIRYHKPFILTKETGLYDRLKDVGIFVDPENVAEIAEKIIWLADDKNYLVARQKIERFNFTHSWLEIAKEFISLFQKI